MRNLSALIRFLRPRPELRPLVWIAFAKLALHLVLAHRYDYFIDEFYYLACAERPAFGYVDHPPLSIWILAGLQFLVRGATGLFVGPEAAYAASTSLFVLRLPAALAGAAWVYLVGRLAFALGGGRLAASLAGLFAFAAPIALGMHKFFSMNSIEHALWAAAFLMVARIFRKDEPPRLELRRWLWLGVILGVGLLNKHSMLFFGAGLAATLLFTDERRRILRPGPWLAAGIALLLVLPHLIWQWQNDFPTLEFARNATRLKNVSFAPLAYLAAQWLENGPLVLPLALAGVGLVFLLRFQSLRRSRAANAANATAEEVRLELASRLTLRFLLFYATVLGLLLLTNAKTYYLTPAYPPLFAAGALGLEAARARLRATNRLRSAFAMLLGAVAVPLASLVLLAPLALPFLSPEGVVAYQRALGLSAPKNERQAEGELPQHLADMFGWREMAAAVERALETSQPELWSDAERAAVAEGGLIVGAFYGHTAALEFFRKRNAYLLPPIVMSGHNNYFLWGPPVQDWPRRSPEPELQSLDSQASDGAAAEETLPLLVVGYSAEELAPFCDATARLARSECRYCMPRRNKLAILLCRGPRLTPQEAIVRLRRFI